MDDLEADCESLLNDEIRELEFTLMTENLLLLDTNSSSSVNDADFADTPLGMHIPEETDWLNAPIPDPNDPLLFNFNTLPIQIPDIDYYTLHQNWYPDMMPTLTEDSPSATLNSSSVSEQSPVFSPAYSTSPLSTNFSPREQLLPQSLGPTPTPTHASPPKKKPRKRRAKAEPGSRACDKKRERRKIDRPVPCDFCPKRFPDNRDMKRHLKAKHPEEAAKRGEDMRKIPCELCEETFARSDHLKRHKKTQHGIE